jgi:putative transposase
MRKHLPHLDHVFVETPIFYVTVCASERRKKLANRQMHEICCEVWRNAESLYGWLVRRYVVMPDHVHFFCASKSDERPLSFYLGKWKEWTAKYALRRLKVQMPLWQPEYFDHVLRSFDSYEEKWLYVRDNPTRAGLVSSFDEWPFHGELNELRWS